jgi:hypothetical protein
MFAPKIIRERLDHLERVLQEPSGVAEGKTLLRLRGRQRDAGAERNHAMLRDGTEFASAEAPAIHETGGRNLAPRRSDALGRGARGGWKVPTAAGSMTKEAALLLFDSVRANVSTIHRISFACTQGRIETE